LVALSKILSATPYPDSVRKGRGRFVKNGFSETVVFITSEGRVSVLRFCSLPLWLLFVPGGISDIEALQATGWLKSGKKNITLLKRLCEARGLRGYETNEISRFMQNYKDYRGRRLLRYVYQHYPYYAVKSKIARDVVSKETYRRIQAERSRTIKQKPVLYTIGYEGSTFEAYINKLIANDIRLLCDVRKNPLSRKFGFSKGILSRVLPKLGIEYLHVPELGIVPQKRKQLKTKDDYACLFAEYRKSLPEKATCLQELAALMESYQRIALTCFEMHPHFCHRHCISDYLEAEKDMVVVHL
jgi:hypothetical protein